MPNDVLSEASGSIRNALVSASSVSSPQSSRSDIDALISTLNAAQLEAVKHDPATPLQILAGPGSGKTKVLTSRIAQLILTHNIAPESICAVTFTNKAANEMRERLNKLIGKTKTTSLKMGTFHSLCARFLRMHPRAVDIETNFTICDADESKKLINELMKPYKDYMVQNDIILTESSAASVVSKAKAKGHSAATYFQEMESAEKQSKRLTNGMPPRGVPGQEETKSIERILAEIYIGYEQILKENNALDFDDLLIYGVKLFSRHQEAVLWCKHILIDEFQDTNTMQYELMKAIAIRRCVTIVGDPDQSIYGWRSAEVINLSRMRKDFPNTEQIFLEQNYRSTASILRTCLAIVSEDKKRIPKSLHTSHPLGATPVLAKFDSDKEESNFIAAEIKRCVANMGGILKWGDFVILLRFNALSRPIESALQKEGIPCRILGGHKFFERMEVKDILAYLQLTDNPSFNPAFIRTVKVPTRGMGDKTLSEIASLATKLKISQFDVVEKIHDNKIPDIKPPVRRKITSFVKIIRTLKKMDEDNKPPSEMIRELVDLLNYEDHLKKTQQDWESRWENVQELITFASEVESEATPPNPQPNVQSEETEQSSTLRQFLQVSMLSSEGDNQTEEQNHEKVTLSTCHAAKGLEWPVVMVPSVDQDTFPFYRTEDVDEERRLLYVACTRAQTLLYMLYSHNRQVAGKTKQKKLSDFIMAPRGKNEGFFSYDVPRFLPEDRAVISEVLGRPLPDEAEIESRLAELELNGDRVQPVFRMASGRMATVSLTGIKSFVDEAPNETVNLAAMYAAPDALAAISASFMKDYKKKQPFSLPPKPPSNVPFNNSFAAASTGTYIHSIQSGISSYTSNTNFDLETYLDAPQESSKQASRNCPPQVFNQIVGRMGPSSSNSVIRSAPTPKSSGLPHLSGTCSAPPPSSIAPPIMRHPSTAPSKTRYFHQVSSHQTAQNTVLHISRKSTIPGSGSHSILYRENQAPSAGPFNSGSRNSNSSTEWNTNALDYNMTLVGPDTSADSTTIESSPPKRANYPRLSGVPVLPTVKNMSSLTEASRSQPGPQTVPPTAGVKRRLGMGRNTTGYSNKKFKKPV